jgi:hypothetical protein
VEDGDHPEIGRNVAKNKIKTARALLKQIQEFWADGEVQELEKKRVWRVLTALRGPDFGGPVYRNETKRATTAVIRHRLLGFNLLQGFTERDLESSVRRRRRMSRSGMGHFGLHAMEAFEVLGLKWDYLNPDKQF